MNEPTRSPALGDVEEELFDPQLTEKMMDEYRYEDWEEGDSCPACGSDIHTTKSLVLDEMDEFDVGPKLAYADCENCSTILYRHPKWVIYQMVGSEYAYSPY